MLHKISIFSSYVINFFSGTVSVLQPPSLVEVPVNVTVVLGGTARLACRPHTDPEYRDFVTVQWLKHYSINGSTKDEQGYPLFRSVEVRSKDF